MSGLERAELIDDEAPTTAAAAAARGRREAPRGRAIETEGLGAPAARACSPVAVAARCSKTRHHHHRRHCRRDRCQREEEAKKAKAGGSAWEEEEACQASCSWRAES